MDIRDSFSRIKKKLKHLGRKHKPDGAGIDAGGGGVDSTDSLLRPEARIVLAGGSHDREGNETSAGGSQACLTDQLPHPGEPEPVSTRGGGNDQEEGEADVAGSRSHLHPDVEGVVGSGPGREGDDVEGEKLGQLYPSPSIPLITHSGEPDGM